MDRSPVGAQSFIVRIWLEETVEEAGKASWRGHVTHAGSGERRYLQELGEITDFIAPYLQQMGVHVAQDPGTGRWLDRWRRYWKRRG